jgi:hypothetical protein
MNRIELAARQLCIEDGDEPDNEVVFLMGDDLTAEELDDMPLGLFGTIVETMGPMWRLYRPKAAYALSRMDRLIREAENVYYLRRPFDKEEAKVG